MYIHRWSPSLRLSYNSSLPSSISWVSFWWSTFWDSCNLFQLHLQHLSVPPAWSCNSVDAASARYISSVLDVFLVNSTQGLTATLMASFLMKCPVSSWWDTYLTSNRLCLNMKDFNVFQKVSESLCLQHNWLVWSMWVLSQNSLNVSCCFMLGIFLYPIPSSTKCMFKVMITKSILVWAPSSRDWKAWTSHSFLYLGYQKLIGCLLPITW